MSVNHYASVIFTKSQQHVEWNAKIKVSIWRIPWISVGISRDYTFLRWHGYIVLERAGYTNVSVAINLHTVEFISNLIEHKCNYFPVSHQIQQLVCLSSVFPRRIENFHAVIYINLAVFLYGYSYLIAVSKRCISEWIVRVSLDLDDAIVEDWLILDVENVSHFLDISHRESQRL